MRLLIDESAAEELEDLLPAQGIEARHVRRLGLPGADDPALLALARREYDAIVTRDRYRKNEPRAASLLQMRAGLRIIELRFRRAGDGATMEQLSLLLKHRSRIEEVIQPDSQLRKLVLNWDTGTITSQMDEERVAAEIARLGL